MPEGPEIYYLATYLKSKILKKTFTCIVSNTKTERDLPKKSVVVDVQSKGKIVWIKTKDYYVHLHMGISGWLVEDKPKIYKYVLEFGDLKIYLKDQRRFSSVDIFNEKQHKKSLDELGTDILTKKFTLTVFKDALKDSSRNVSALLMDQSVFSGIGNYIRNDALYLSKIKPTRKVSDISDDEAETLYNKIRFVAFSNAIEWLKNDNLKIPKSLKSIAPKKLSIPYRFRIYEREKIGNKKVKFSKVAGRNTYSVDTQK